MGSHSLTDMVLKISRGLSLICTQHPIFLHFNYFFLYSPISTTIKMMADGKKIFQQEEKAV
jgi:hypothetical protein